MTLLYYTEARYRHLLRPPGQVRTEFRLRRYSDDPNYPALSDARLAGNPLKMETSVPSYSFLQFLWPLHNEHFHGQMHSWFSPLATIIIAKPKLPGGLDSFFQKWEDIPPTCFLHLIHSRSVESLFFK